MSAARVFNAHETARERALDGRPLASFRARAAALAIDFVIAGLLFMLLVYPAARLAVALGIVQPKGDVKIQLNFFGNWYSVVWLVLYFGFATWLGNGRTPGKRLMGIRVQSLAHEKLGLWHSIERALGYGASALEFGFGFVQYFIHPNRMTVHDRIAETIVVTERTSAEPAVTPEAANGADTPICVRCDRPVTVNRDHYAEVFERMHFVCFHLEYEHDGDTDAGCGPTCPIRATIPATPRDPTA